MILLVDTDHLTAVFVLYHGRRGIIILLTMVFCILKHSNSKETMRQVRPGDIACIPFGADE
jgi:hypothetical protein